MVSLTDRSTVSLPRRHARVRVVHTGTNCDSQYCKLVSEWYVPVQTFMFQLPGPGPCWRSTSRSWPPHLSAPAKAGPELMIRSDRCRYRLGSNVSLVSDRPLDLAPRSGPELEQDEEKLRAASQRSSILYISEISKILGFVRS